MAVKTMVGLAGFVFFVASASEQQPSLFLNLQAKVRELQKASAVELVILPVVDCSQEPVTVLESASRGGGLSQYIFNSMYQWEVVEVAEGRCFYLKQPENRGLTTVEASILNAASGMEFPVPEQQVAASEGELVKPRPIGNGKNPTIHIDH